MLSSLLNIDSAIRTFFNQLTETLGFAGFLGIFLGVELLFILAFGIKSALSYEARAKRAIDRANQWLFKNKVIDTKNIKVFNEVIKQGPKRLLYFWQQYILYREGAPSKYMTIDNIIEKPLKSSGWANSVRNLSIVTFVWAAFALVFGLASQAVNPLSFPYIAVALVIPCAVILAGMIAVIIIKSVRVVNLDDLYHIFHLFTRFVDNACAELPPFIDFDLLFTAKEIENGNPQLREYYEARARKAKEEFENAKKNDIEYVHYEFEDVGFEGKNLLNRAMKVSEDYINTRTATLSKIAQANSHKDALRRNYENVQMDLQRKIQASKENIQKYIEQQTATTSRIEVGLLRQQQDKEAKKQEALQRDYDKEEARFKADKAALDAEIEELNQVLEESLAEAEKGMAAEYHTFYEKVMKSAYAVAEKKAEDEKKEIKKQSDKNEKELINVQTQIKRLMDENLTLKERLEEFNPDYKQDDETIDGQYDDEGNFVYADGSYHSPDGLFHDIDGKIYDMNGIEVTEEVAEYGATEESLINDQINQFGSFVSTEEALKEETYVAEPEIQKVEPVAEDAEPVIQEEMPEIQSQEISAEKTEESVTQEIPTRRRGRPRKIVSEQPKKEEPKKPRGRPRKVVVAEEKAEVSVAAKKRGRPRKTEVKPLEEKTATSERKRGRPRKETTGNATQKPSTGGKRGRPKGSVKKKEQAVVSKPKKRGRPRKSPILGEDIDSLSKISKLISEEEDKLTKMKVLLNSEIDEVLKEERQNKVDKEREELIKAVEALKAQAAGASQDSKSEQELASINGRLEDLIKEISILNNKK